MPFSFDQLSEFVDKIKRSNYKRYIFFLVEALAAVLVLVLVMTAVSRCTEVDAVPSAAETAVPETPATEQAETEPATVPATQAAEPTESVPEPELAEETVPQRIFYEQVPQYFQNDYPNNRFGRGTIESHGCGITCLAMVATYLTGHEYLPDELADYFGGYGQSNMQKLEYGSDKLQLPWKKAQNVHEVMRALESGSVAILLMDENSVFTNSEHFIVVTGINDEGLYTINDPYKPNYDVWGLKQGFESGFEEYAIVKGYLGGWIYDVSAMPEDPFLYEEIKSYVEPRYTEIQLTPEEKELLARIIWVEARGESAEGQQAVAEVVFNRMLAEDYPDTLQGVLSYQNQFPSIELLEKAEPEQAQYDAIEDALNGPYILPLEVLHFATYPTNEYVWGTIGGHVFCYRWGTGPDATEAPADTDS